MEHRASIGLDMTDLARLGQYLFDVGDNISGLVLRGEADMWDRQGFGVGLIETTYDERKMVFSFISCGGEKGCL